MMGPRRMAAATGKCDDTPSFGLGVRPVSLWKSFINPGLAGGSPWIGPERQLHGSRRLC